jgi:hypothetical protein
MRHACAQRLEVGVDIGEEREDQEGGPDAASLPLIYRLALRQIKKGEGWLSLPG